MLFPHGEMYRKAPFGKGDSPYRGDLLVRLAEMFLSYLMLSINLPPVILRMTNGHPYGVRKCASETVETSIARPISTLSGKNN